MTLAIGFWTSWARSGASSARAIDGKQVATVSPMAAPFQHQFFVRI
jgi:hypothetical protein